ncbi:MAG: superoxide dismutase [Thermoanaerobaculales bacterium]|jgi:Fe-Mn family superoxide dismutase|nr:superoxide dismutase [Thermoanaerobaculales bacterium]
MAHQLPDLPFGPNDLEPFISAETLEYHHGKHHKAYVDNLNKLTAGTPQENASLEDLIKTADGGVFNNAAQVWNHTFYWNCLKAGGGAAPSAGFEAKLAEAFGSFDEFKSKFNQAAVGQFGSGWAWLVKNQDGSLAITTSANAENPIRNGQTPLLTCDVWEHAYYVDFRNARPKYLEAFWGWVNWEFVESNL